MNDNPNVPVDDGIDQFVGERLIATLLSAQQTIAMLRQRSGRALPQEDQRGIDALLSELESALKELKADNDQELDQATDNKGQDRTQGTEQSRAGRSTESNNERLEPSQATDNEVQGREPHADAKSGREHKRVAEVMDPEPVGTTKRAQTSARAHRQPVAKGRSPQRALGLG